MNIYIHEWPNKTATLMLEDGTSLFTFSNTDTAKLVYDEWYKTHIKEMKSRRLSQDPGCSTLC